MQTILMEYLSRLLNLQKNKFQVDTVEFAMDERTSLKIQPSTHVCVHWNSCYLFRLDKNTSWHLLLQIVVLQLSN